jgi:hypothetical protein
MAKNSTGDTLESLQGDAPRAGTSISRIAAWSHNTRCPTASAAFAARVDLDKLLAETEYAPSVGESPFMRQRGQLFEHRVREDGYRDLVAILRSQLGFDRDVVVPLNLKNKYSPNEDGLKKRAEETRKWMGKVLKEDPDAADLIEGAVLPLHLGSYTAYFEADGIGVRTGPIVHGIEMKSWPQVDGRVDDPAKASEALRQLGFYLYLLRNVVSSLGGDPALVSDSGLLVTPRNVGLVPVGGVRDLAREIALAEAVVDRLPRASGYSVITATGMSFGSAAPSGGDPPTRLGHLAALTSELGTHYQTSCISSCGLARFCRARRHEAGDAAVCGTNVVRFLPGVTSLGRAAELASGAAPTDDELRSGAPEVLSRAGALYSQRRPARRA